MALDSQTIPDGPIWARESVTNRGSGAVWCRLVPHPGGQFKAILNHFVVIMGSFFGFIFWSFLGAFFGPLFGDFLDYFWVPFWG